MRTGKDRVQVEDIQSAVTIGKVRIEPSDWLLADGDGVLSIPLNRVAQVFETACIIDLAEKKIRELVRQGMPLSEARLETGYHTLQRRS